MNEPSQRKRRRFVGAAATLPLLQPLARSAGGLAALGLGTWSTSVPAQESFPSRGIRFVVPFPPGPAGDLVARYYGKGLQDLTGQPVVIDNKPGGNGIIGAQTALQQPADGYTLFIASNSPMAANVALLKTMPYDPVKDFAPVHGLMLSPMVILTTPERPYRTIQDLIEASRAKGGKLTYSVGTAAYRLMVERFLQQAGGKGVSVYYKGGMEAVKGLMSGDVDFTIIDLTAPLPLIQAGKLRPLAVATKERLPALPDVPTAHEAGITDYQVAVWVAAFVRAGTPEPIRARLAELLGKLVNSPEAQAHYGAQQAEPMKMGPAELGAFQQGEVALWKRVAQEAGIEPQ